MLCKRPVSMRRKPEAARLCGGWRGRAGVCISRRCACAGGQRPRDVGCGYLASHAVAMLCIWSVSMRPWARMPAAACGQPGAQRRKTLCSRTVSAGVRPRVTLAPRGLPRAARHSARCAFRRSARFDDRSRERFACGYLAAERSRSAVYSDGERRGPVAPEVCLRGLARSRGRLRRSRILTALAIARFIRLLAAMWICARPNQSMCCVSRR